MREIYRGYDMGGMTMLQNSDDEKKVYEQLKKAGHSPAKAAEIVLDAKRGDKAALDWIKVACK